MPPIALIGVAMFVLVSANIKAEPTGKPDTKSSQQRPVPIPAERAAITSPAAIKPDIRRESHPQHQPAEMEMTGAISPHPRASTTLPSISSQGKPLQRGTTSLLGTPVSQPPPVPTQNHSDKDEAIIYSELLLLTANFEDAEKQRKSLSALGITIRQRQQLKGLGLVLSLYKVPIHLQNDRALALLQAQYPEFKMEFNRRYRLQGKGHEYAAEMILLPFRHDEGRYHIAMVDAALDPAHKVFEHSDIKYLDITQSQAQPTDHATAVASLMIGQSEMLIGVIPKARLNAINIFLPDSSGQLETRTQYWLQAMDYLIQIKPQPTVVNLSFGGPYSLLLDMIFKLMPADMHFVAAAGNDGPENGVVFPASHSRVIAVTAIDANRKIYSKSVRGKEILLAAPGVDIWSEGVNGGFYASGTSFAAPWVTAVLAMLLFDNNDVSHLYRSAQDLGAQGFDHVFGHGLLQYKKN